MPLEYDDIPGSWGDNSKSWSEIKENAYDKYVFANQTGCLTYGTYVLIGETLRVETQELAEVLTNTWESYGCMTADAVVEQRKKSKKGYWDYETRD